MPRFAVLILSLTLLAGCAGGPPLAPVSANHPASPEAAEAPYARPAGFLDQPPESTGADSMDESAPVAGMSHGHGAMKPNTPGDSP